MPPQDYYSAQQVMDLLRISKRRLYELAERADDLNLNLPQIR